MSSGSLLPICFECARLRGVVPDIGWACEAYQDGIPTDILASVHDHHEPFKGDGGLVFVPKQTGGQDAEWEEQAHPRVAGGSEKGGQFAKKGEIAPNVHSGLIGKGFTPEEGEEAHYRHSSGNRISFLPKSESAEHAYKWQHTNPEGEKTAENFGVNTLARQIGKIQRGEIQTSTTERPEPTRPEPTPTRPEPTPTRSEPTFGGVVTAAKKYLPPGFLDNVGIGPKRFENPNVMGSSTLRGIHLNPDVVKKEHPAYVAGIIYHEMVHQGQNDRGMDPNDLIGRELDAHSKTAAWAQRKLAKATDKNERRALETLYRESKVMADSFARGQTRGGY